MHTKFIQTANVKGFQSALARAQERGAREASWVVAIGEPGLGKSRTLQWWAAHQEAVYLRAKAEWTAYWMLKELAVELKLDPHLRKADLFGSIVAKIRKQEIPIIIDECEKFRGNTRLLETLRDISDLTETEVVMGGTEDGLTFLMRFAQISSRITAVARFNTATISDVKLMCRELAEVTIADDLAAEIHRQSGGYFREVKNALAEVERFGRMNPPGKDGVTAAEMAGRELCRRRLGSGGGARR